MVGLGMMKRFFASGHWEGEPFKSKMIMTSVGFEEKLDVGLPDYKFRIVLSIDEPDSGLGVRIDYEHKPKGSCLLGVGCCWGFYKKL